MEYPVAIVRADREKVEYRSIEAAGAIDAGVRVHEEAASWRGDPLGPGNPLFLGAGPLAGGPLLGSHRLLAVFRSPVSMGLHASALGGAGFHLIRAGVLGLVVEGRSRDPLVVRLYWRGGPEAEVWGLEWGELWRAYREGVAGYRGTRGLHALIAGRLGGGARRSRIIVVGPAAWHTRAGGIFSWAPGEAGMPGAVVDSASRGGGGSVLAQAHGVAGLVVGGPARWRLPRDLLRVVEEALGKEYARAVEEATRKYRYDPGLGTGGTFGVNYVYYRDLLPALAYNTIYYGRHVRMAVHQRLMEWFWRPFQEEVFELGGPSRWRTCGEPCSVACKKVWRGVKLDYEPAHAMGPMIGVFTLPEAAGLVELVDDLGLDAIEAGHTAAWIFDMAQRGLASLDILELQSRPSLDPLAISRETSRVNARLARTMLERLAWGRGGLTGLIARSGLRRAAAVLGELVGRDPLAPQDLLVYAAYGVEGYMTPNYYWSPGMVAPLYVLGRYWTHYSPAFHGPEEYARISYERALQEVAVDDAGLCRFHRKWALPALQPLLEAAGVPGDPLERAARLYARIAAYQVRAGAEPVPWESLKTMDVAATLAGELGIQGWQDAVGDREKMHEWWERFYAEIQRLIAEGL